MVHIGRIELDIYWHKMVENKIESRGGFHSKRE